MMKRPLFNRLPLIALTAVLLALCAGAALLMRRDAAPRSIARIAVDGETWREIDLSAVADETSFDIETPGGWNTVTVRRGAICVSAADCPDQICVRQGWLEGGLVPIVCLPHRLVISLVSGGEEEAFDAVSG